MENSVFESRDSPAHNNPFSKLDEIDQALVSKILALPGQSILNAEGTIEFDNLLRLYKGLYEH